MIRDFIKFRLRRGSLFEKLSREAEKTIRYSEAELQCYRNEKLQQTVQIAFKSVPFYRKMMLQKKLSDKDIRTSEDLVKLPVIDKKTVRDHYSEFRNKAHQGLAIKANTCGTTGMPGVFLRDLYSINYEQAVIWRYYRQIGKPFNSGRVILRGDLIFPVTKNSPPFWKYDSFTNELFMSSYHLSNKNMGHYVREIRRFKPWDLQAYPSTAYFLAHYCRRMNLKLSFSAVFTSSETLLDFQKEEIETVFGCKVYDWYGNGERVAAIGQCEHSSYHEVADANVIEYLPSGKGREELVGTTLHNFVMPLIRYRTGDIVERGEKIRACQCGILFPQVKRIYGRESGFLWTPCRGKIPAGALGRILWGVENLLELQFVQKKLDEIEVLIVVTPAFSAKNLNFLEKRLASHISDEVRFIITKVPYIRRSLQNKFQWIIQELGSQDPGFELKFTKK